MKLLLEMKKRIAVAPAGGFQHPEDDNKIVDAVASKGLVELTPLGKSFLMVCFSV